MSKARPASTIVLMRPSMKILFLRRSRKASFFPNAWVFPGGRVDLDDALIPTQGSVEGLENKAYGVAALRECFEEAGVWIGLGNPSESFRQELNHRKTTLKEDATLIADLDRLSLFSRWITPTTEPKRYDTLFFLAQLTENEHPIPQADQHETVESAWYTPTEVIEEHKKGEVSLAPPTLLTLMELEKYDSYSELMKGKRDMRPILPLHYRDPELEILLPGHPKHSRRRSWRVPGKPRSSKHRQCWPKKHKNCAMGRW